MKRLFGRSKRYQEDLEWEDWDEAFIDEEEAETTGELPEEEGYLEAGMTGELPEEEEYLEEGMTGELPEEEEYLEAGMTGELPEEEEYLEAGMTGELPEEEEYLEAGMTGELPEEEEYYEAEQAEEFAGGEDAEELSAEDEEFYEEEYEEEDEEEILAWKDMPDKNIFQKIWYSMVHMGTMDRVITTTGVLILVLALVTGAVFLSARMLDREVASFDMVGTQLDGITLIGEQGLTAVADAELAKIQAANAIEEENQEETEYEENEYSREIEVTLNMTSIEKDLKLKFVNSKTHKLIANVPFSVTVKTPDGKTETWTDDDMDGIIYKSGITPGDYSVTMNALTDKKYEGYGISTTPVKITVRKEIAYEKVDVSDEIKDESELDQKEDAENELEVESELTDTVAWVESTVTPGEVVWTEVPRSQVNVDVLVAARPGDVMRVAVEKPLSAIGGQIFSFPGNEAVPLAAPRDISGNGETSPSPDSSPSPEASASPPPESSAAPSPSVTEIKLSKTELSLTVGASETLTAEILPSEAKDTKLIWEVDQSSVVKVESGTVTALAKGQAVVTVKTEDGAVTAKCNVTVTELDFTVTVTPAAFTIVGGSSVNVTAVVNAKGATLTASSNSTGIAEAAVGTPSESDGKTTAVLTVSGKAAGDAVITVTAKVNGTEKSATIAVKVISKENKLVDKNNNQLWVKVAEDKYEEATYSHYANTGVTMFYIRTETVAKYTGWQSLNGKMYYFDANGNKVTGEQVIQGAKYNFASDGSLVVGSGSFGIDVSKWNGKIDWAAVKNSGVSYVIIRCGYRGYGSGALVVDPYFEQNIKGATAAGIKVGVYFFSQAVNRVEGVEEASMVLQLIRGYTISYPVFLDVEDSGAGGGRGRADGLSVADRTEVIKAFCETIQNSGYTAGVYANKSWLTNKIDTSQLSRYKIWLAQYAAAPTYTGRYDMWQYKSTGRVTGISTDVDLNLSYLGY